MLAAPARSKQRGTLQSHYRPIRPAPSTSGSDSRAPVLIKIKSAYRLRSLNLWDPANFSYSRRSASAINIDLINKGEIMYLIAATKLRRLCWTYRNV
ncbi:protein of unknown function (plasmid) [Cupriavidus taiwanensis]|uniref:Uncharacterized protein n=1 Tax=Cupriavidus taiwanensis TaxID=164546 RepID=A0A375EBJ2_9BURK|nr:protein of unknown function [Cupriavidus taiwanensis]SOZ72125.1 protein of unknown function [Cupriavidus taiwanensis]SOZ74421.1 protein of unknown function [Cupriavidus taiwanensis]